MNIHGWNGLGIKPEQTVEEVPTKLIKYVSQGLYAVIEEATGGKMQSNGLPHIQRKVVPAYMAEGLDEEMVD